MAQRKPVVIVNGSFTELSPNDTIDGASQFDPGTASSPGLFVAGSSSTGIYSPGTNQLAISTNGAGRLFVDASGKVGVNTSSPSHALQVESDANSNIGVWVRNINTGSSASSNVLINSATGQLLLRAHSAAHSVWPSTALISSSSGLTGGIALNTATTAPIAFLTNNTERLRITSAGLVGIGTSSPGATLSVDSASTALMSTYNSTNANGGYIELRSSGTVYGDVGTAAQLVSGGSASDFCLNARGSRGFALGTNNATRLYINSSGSVGIGTTSPARPLQVNSTQISARFLSSSSDSQIEIVDSSGTVVFGSSSANAIVQVGGAERARIDSSGRLLVGTSTNSGGALLQVNGDRIRVGTAKTPASATDTGTAGEICWDANYVYVCTATNTWKRAALSTW